MYKRKKMKKQGRIHGYLSRVQVGRESDEINQPSSWAGAVTPKPPVNAEKAKCDGPTDGRTDRRTDRAGCRVTCRRLKRGRTDMAWSSHIAPV